MAIPEDQWSHLAGIILGLAHWIAGKKREIPLFIGINGAQGSGKSTTAELLAITLEAVHGLRTLQFSIDDIYLTHAERQILAHRIHPLLATRGVPGTHDMALMDQTLSTLRDATPNSKTPIPGFDKANDDRLQEHLWRTFFGKPDVIILEGWCVGSMAQPDRMLDDPINTLESEEDPKRVWRTFVNEQLKGPYRQLFDQLDLMLMLKIPDFSLVREWRSLQEKKLSQNQSALAPSRIMNPHQLERFIMHFERITRWNLEQLPRRADLTLELSSAHRFHKTSFRQEDPSNKADAPSQPH